MVFVTRKSKVDEPLAVEGAGHRLQNPDAPLAVLDQLVVGRQNARDAALDRGRGKRHTLLTENVSPQAGIRRSIFQVVEPDELVAKTQEIAGRLASGPTVAFSYMKENFARALTSGDVHDCLDLEVSHHVHCAGTEDHKNAAKAFVEKREPEFKGR